MLFAVLLVVPFLVWAISTVWAIFNQLKKLSVSQHTIPGLALDQRKVPDPKLFPSLWRNRLGLWLHFRVWKPRNTPCKAVVLLVHGYGDAIHRYEHVCEVLVANGFAVVGYDQQGHGRSEGERCYVEHFHHLVQDVMDFIPFVMSRNPDLESLPRFAVAHSLGALVLASFLLKDLDNSKGKFSGVTFCAPAFQLFLSEEKPTWKLVAFLSRFFPKFDLPVRSPIHHICRHPQAIEFYKTDPLVRDGPNPARTVANMVMQTKHVQRHAKDISVPVLAVFGGSDKLCVQTGCENFVSSIQSKDKVMKVYPNMEHEVLHDVDWQVVTGDILGWMNRHLGK